MIKFLAKLMYELQKQGYDWNNAVEVRVRDGEIWEYVYDISRKEDVFEVSLHVVNETGKLTEVKPVIRETIEQVVDYILE